MTDGPHIAIIGAGISGIASAKILYENGFHNLTIFEASTRIGGRIHTVSNGNSFIEMGAQWIHGQVGNILYEYGMENNLIVDPTEDFGFEGIGSFCSEDGILVNCDDLYEMIAYLDRAKEMNQCEDKFDQPINMYDFFRYEFDEFISKRSYVSKGNLKLLKQAFRWFILFELIDNGCDSIRKLSPLSYTEWKDYDGVDLINLHNGYGALLKQLENEFPLEQMVQLKSAVRKIMPFVDGNKIKIKLQIEKLLYTDEKATNFTVKETNESIFDHVIITSSIGFLKANLNNDFFNFLLPKDKVDVIRSLGYGTINKIFLYFNEPFWFDDEKGFQVIWSSIIDENCYDYECRTNEIDQFNQKFPKWVYYISGFDLVGERQPNMMLAWIGSIGAIEMEKETDEQIRLTIGDVLQQIIPRSRRSTKLVPTPDRVYISRWHSNPFTLGSYSNRTTDYEQLQCDGSKSLKHNIDVLAKPIYSGDIITQMEIISESDCPKILFAGEATDLEHYSTTDGAFRSGIREAQNLINYYQTKS
ncbi:hypothetical protein BLOT_007810 [Blomia tropicalis]|nr:hypothetical protein BLOT_007810 [Blomia tropicalis]